jgi:hypothetical protein
MLRPVRNDLLLASLAPDIGTTIKRTLQVPRLVEPLSVKVARSVAPAALQENEKLCHFHLDPRFVLLLRGANVEHQIPRNLYDNTRSRISLPV